MLQRTVNSHAVTLGNKIVESEFQPDTPKHDEKQQNNLLTSQKNERMHEMLHFSFNGGKCVNVTSQLRPRSSGLFHVEA